MPKTEILSTNQAMTTLLVMIPVPPDEAKQRLARAKQDAKAARKQAAGLLQFGPKDQRTAKKVKAFTDVAEMNDRIVEGCARALEDAASSAPEGDTPQAIEDMPDIAIEEESAADERPEPVLTAADVDEEGG